METTGTKNTATFTHLSVLTQYFIPFGNFIFPIVIWSSAKKDSAFIDNHGRNAINFQLSLFLYTLVLCLIAIPTIIYAVFNNVSFQAIENGDDFFIENLSAGNITGIVVVALMAAVVFFALKVAEFFLVIYASVKAANGEDYTYPLTINFIKQDRTNQPGMTQAGLQPEA